MAMPYGMGMMGGGMPYGGYPAPYGGMPYYPGYGGMSSFMHY
jgi:hypothetical protein